MKLRLLSLCFLFLLTSGGLAQTRRPNIVFILADDMGYRDAGRNLTNGEEFDFIL